MVKVQNGSIQITYADVYDEASRNEKNVLEKIKGEEKDEVSLLKKIRSADLENFEIIILLDMIDHYKYMYLGSTCRGFINTLERALNLF